ncbi:hypothetical protein U5F73_03225 [Stenotrophomonas pavanii]|uniref:hypothetical protein n=1 Tax=Stenotrophomonas pavanii TaxID=487698 RepID=UPI0028972397|nr:hypothetical protein [Stenotrophomonas pavanii]MDZ7474020.1 hypothetical protein [Stenotrophomonas pavanii]
MAASPADALAMLLAREPPAREAYRASRALNTPQNNRKDLLVQLECSPTQLFRTARLKRYV